MGPSLPFLSHLPNDSALKRELNGEASAWLDGTKIAPLLADIFDLLNKFRYEHAVSKSPKESKPKAPDEYPRPQANREPSEPFDYDGLRARLYA